ncbi:MAG: hypothetical protein WCV86_05165 [Patescibacteria group bacterium]|jgi:hypothetical protein
MNQFKSKVFSSILLVTFLISLLVSGFASPNNVSAQAICDPAEQLCVDSTAVCNVEAIRNLFGGDADGCLVIVYNVSRLLFVEPTPHPWYNPSIQEFQQKVFDDSNPDEIFGERYTYAQVNWVMNSFFSMLFPPILSSNDPLELFQFVLDVVEGFNEVREVLFTQAGAGNLDLAFLDKFGVIGQTYHGLFRFSQVVGQVPSLPSGVNEVRQFAARLNIATDAFAQGSGYDRLNIGAHPGFSATRGLWQATRNMALLIATLVIIVAGFMVMFRSRLNPQLSVTVQIIIPRIAIALVLIMFSYAIAGFVVDMMYIVISAILGIISFTQGVSGGYNIVSDLNMAVAQLVGGRFDFIWHFLGIWIVLSLILVIVGVIVGALMGLASGGLIILAIGFVLGFFLWSIYVWARIMGQFIVAFLSFNLLVVAGPLMIVFDILPAKEDFGGFKKWLMCLIGNASVFVTYALLAIFINAAYTTITPVPGFNGGTGFFFNNNAAFPLFILPNNWLTQYLIFVALMSMAPNVVTSVKNLFCKSMDPSDFIEKSVKDTLGQVTGAGQNVGKGADEREAAALQRSRQMEEDAQKAKSASTTGEGATPNPTLKP